MVDRLCLGIPESDVAEINEWLKHVQFQPIIGFTVGSNQKGYHLKVLTPYRFQSGELPIEITKDGDHLCVAKTTRVLLLRASDGTGFEASEMQDGGPLYAVFHLPEMDWYRLEIETTH